MVPRSRVAPKVVHLFCGAGGLTRGLADAGFDVVAGIDRDPAAAYSYSANNDAEFIEKDIAEVSATFLNSLLEGGSHKILVGCAPCQAFSTYTQGLVHEDDKRWS